MVVRRMLAGWVPLVFVLSLAAGVEAAELAQSNRPVDDVEAAFRNLTLQGEWLGWHQRFAPFTTPPPIPLVNSDQHYQGVARSPRTGRAPILYVTRSGDNSDPEDVDRHGHFLTIRLGSRNQDGERLRSNRLGPEETKNTEPPAEDEVIGSFRLEYQHPGGVQMVGDVLAIPLETPGLPGLPPGKVAFFNCSNPEIPVRMPVEVHFEHNVGVLAITKLPDGHFLLVTTHGDGDVLEIFRSNGDDFLAPGFAFEPHDVVPVTEIDGFWRTGKTSPQAMSLVNQSDGRLFLVASSNSVPIAPHVNGDDHMFLYEITGFEAGGEVGIVQRDTIRHKSLRSHGNEVIDWEPLGDADLILGAACALGIPGWNVLCLIDGVLARQALHDNFAKHEANFNASGGAYVTPSGELLYYTTEYYNLGPSGTGRFAELRHRDVSRHATCGPQFRPNHLGGPYVVPEGGTLTLDGTVHVVDAWVEMFEDVCFNCAEIDNSCRPGVGCDPTVFSVTMDRADQHLDRFDDFKRLDGFGIFGANGFNDELSSFRFCGPPGTRLTLFDDDGFHEGNAPNFVVEGSGQVVAFGRVGSEFDDEATSARIDRLAAPSRSGYHWDLDGDGSFECVPPTYGSCTAADGGRRVEIAAGCGGSSRTVRLIVDDGQVDAQLTVQNVPPAFGSLSLDPEPSLEAGAVVLSGTWSDACPGPHTLEVHWGDGERETLDLGEAAEGGFSATHVYGDDGVYTLTLSLADAHDFTPAQRVHAVHNLPPSLALDTSGAVATAGGLAFLAQAGVPATHRAAADDAGSDDLRFRWIGEDAAGAEVALFSDRLYPNDGLQPDPPQSPQGNLPFHAEDEIAATFPAGGLFRLAVAAIDDDGGHATARLPVLVTGAAAGGEAACARTAGAWRREVARLGNPSLPEPAVLGFLALVDFASGAFAERLPAATLADAAAALAPGGAEVGDPDPANRRGKAAGDLLAAWLNVASGAVDPLAPADLEAPAGETALAALARLEAVVFSEATGERGLRQASQELARINNRGCP